VIFSIGHSSLGPDEFLALLADAPATTLWDVRSFPSSHWPWFARDELERRLEAAGVSYRWVKDLGGRRGAPRRPTAPPDSSPDVAGTRPPVAPPAAPAPPASDGELTLFAAPPAAPGWRSGSFENYMWYMASPAFLAAGGGGARAARPPPAPSPRLAVSPAAAPPRRRRGP
jgi:hypothetical protein